MTLFRSRHGQTGDEVSLDSGCRRLIIWGQRGSLSRSVALREETGEVGALTRAGRASRHRTQGDNSTLLPAGAVLPQFKAAIGTTEEAA